MPPENTTLLYELEGRVKVVDVDVAAVEKELQQFFADMTSA